MDKLHDSEGMVLTQSPCPLLQLDSWSDELAAFEAAIIDATGVCLPCKVGQISVHGDLTVTRVGPRRFWLFPKGSRPFACAVPRELGCALDLSEGRVRIRIVNPDLRTTVAGCLAIDWDATAGVATFSSLHRIPVMFMRSSENEGEFIVPRSFARSISQWLAGCR